MSSAAKLFQEDQRLVILRALLDASAYSANESVMQTHLAMYGHNIGRDLISNHTSWLEEQGLVTVDQLPMGVRVVKLTGRGEDVANGVTRVPGVKRPRAR